MPSETPDAKQLLAEAYVTMHKELRQTKRDLADAERERDRHKQARELGWSLMECGVCGAVQAGMLAAQHDLAERLERAESANGQLTADLMDCRDGAERAARERERAIAFATDKCNEMAQQVDDERRAKERAETEREEWKDRWRDAVEQASAALLARDRAETELAESEEGRASYRALYDETKTELAAVRERSMQNTASVSGALVRAGIPAFGTPKEGVENLAAELAAVQAENEVLREQNFAMNKTIVDSLAPDAVTVREDAARTCERLAEMMEQGAGEPEPGGRLRQAARLIRDAALTADAASSARKAGYD